MNENVGSTLHSLNNFKHDPQYAVYQAGKYIDRLCDAAIKLEGKIAYITEYQSLRIIGDQAVKEKKGFAGKDPMTTHEQGSFFSTKTESDIDFIKEQALRLGAKTIAAYKKIKA